MPVLAARRAGDRVVDGREDIEVPAETGGRQDSGYLRRRRGQAQESAAQPGAAPGAHQDGKAPGVRVIYHGQVDDEPAGGGTEQAKELLAQRGSSRDVEFAAERGDDVAALGPAGNTEANNAISGRVHHRPPIRWARTGRVAHTRPGCGRR